MSLRHRVFLHFILGTAALAWSAAAQCQAVKPSSGAAAAIPEPGEIFRDCLDCSEMVVVPAGEFKMGSGDTAYEKPEHRVVIANPFAIGRREVTFEEWDLCVAAGGCKYRPDDHGWGRGSRPVMDVSWDDAKAFVAWLSQKTQKGYRLPSEAEWVEDCWNESYRGAPTDGSAWTTGQCRQRALRGGSFASRANVIRSAARFRYDQDVRYYANGFRVAR